MHILSMIYAWGWILVEDCTDDEKRQLLRTILLRSTSLESRTL